MESTMDIFKEYLDTPDTDYAILITGTWGCGKTYFWKNKLAPIIEKNKTIYISLYGVASLDDIAVKILSQLLYESDNNCLYSIMKLGASFAEKIGLKNTGKAVTDSGLIKLNNYFICFDDLERTNLEIKDILGYINHYVEHENVKCCIICDEKKVAKQEGYNEIKEKTIGKTVLFTPNAKEAVEAIIKSYSPDGDAHKFLLEQKEIVISTFINSKSENVRTLKRGIQNIVNIHSAVNESLSKMPKNLRAQIVQGILAYTIEYMINGSNENVLSDLETIAKCATPYALPELIFPKEEDNYIKKFCDKYMLTSSLTAFSPFSILEYITKGYINKDQVIADIESLLPKSDPEKEQIYFLMNDFWRLNLNEFDKIVDEVLEKVNRGEYESPGLYRKLYGRFLWFSLEGLVKINLSKIDKIFIKGIATANENGRLVFKAYDDYPEVESNIQEINDKIVSYRKHICDLEDKSKEREMSETAEGLLIAAKESSEKFFGVFDNKDEYLSMKPFLTFVDAHNLFEILINSWDAHALIGFKDILYRRYHPSNIGESLYVEAAFLKELKDCIVNNKREYKNRFQKWAFSKLEKMLESVVLHLETSREKTEIITVGQS